NPRLPTGPKKAPKAPLFAEPASTPVNPVLPDWVQEAKVPVSKPQFETRFPATLSQMLGMAIAEPLPRLLTIAPMTTAIAMDPSLFINVSPLASLVPPLEPLISRSSAACLSLKSTQRASRSNLSKNQRLECGPRRDGRHVSSFLTRDGLGGETRAPRGDRARRADSG